MSIVNSIVRGFGGQIGRHAANKVLNSKSTSNNDTKNYLSFWEGIKTILWFFPNLLTALVINMIYNMFTGDFLKKDWHPNFQSIVILATIFSLIIGYGYYKNPKYK